MAVVRVDSLLLRAPKGRRVDASWGHVAGVWNGGEWRAGPLHELRVSGETARRWTVFVDGDPLGSATLAEMLAGGREVLDVLDFEFEQREPNLIVAVHGYRGAGPHLWLEPEGRLEPCLIGGRRDHFGVIVGRGDETTNAKTLGFWVDPEEETLVGSAWVPPGRYEVAYGDWIYRDVVRLEPLEVTAGELSVLHLDLEKARPWTVVPRFAGEEPPPSRVFGLAIGAAAVDIGHLGLGLRSRGAQRPFPDARFGEFWTFDGVPTGGQLLWFAGAGVRWVPLLPCDEDFGGGHVDFVVELPAIRSLTLSLPTRFGGTLCGHIEGPEQDWHDLEYLWGGHIRPVSAVEPEGAGVVRVRTSKAEARGAVYEGRSREAPALRDWFVMGEDAITTLGGGEQVGGFEGQAGLEGQGEILGCAGVD